MKRILSVSVACLLIGLFIFPRLVGAAPKTSAGERAFQKNCAVCHPGGGNIVSAAKDLHRNTLKANGITKPDDIIAKMRNPGPKMTMFDKKTVPDKTARAIAKYILNTFK